MLLFTTTVSFMCQTILLDTSSTCITSLPKAGIIGLHSSLLENFSSTLTALGNYPLSLEVYKACADFEIATRQSTEKFSFWFRLQNNLLQKTKKTLYYLYNSLAPQTMSVKPEPRFQNLEEKIQMGKKVGTIVCRLKNLVVAKTWRIGWFIIK